MFNIGCSLAALQDGDSSSVNEIKREPFSSLKTRWETNKFSAPRNSSQKLLAEQLLRHRFCTARDHGKRKTIIPLYQLEQFTSSSSCEILAMIFSGRGTTR